MGLAARLAKRRLAATSSLCALLSSWAAGLVGRVRAKPQQLIRGSPRAAHVRACPAATPASAPPRPSVQARRIRRPLPQAAQNQAAAAPRMPGCWAALPASSSASCVAERVVELTAPQGARAPKGCRQGAKERMQTGGRKSTRPRGQARSGLAVRAAGAAASRAAPSAAEPDQQVAAPTRRAALLGARQPWLLLPRMA